MNIEVITCMYNEEFLAPFFMNHYEWATKIKVFIDDDTNDGTEDIVRRYPNSDVYKFKFPDMMDDFLKVILLTNAYRSSNTDWVILVDADEFVYHPDIYDFLSEVDADIVIANLYQVYRNIKDKDLDISLPAFPQRIYGDKNTGENKCYNKPIVARGGLPIMWTPGNHFILVDQCTQRYNSAGVLPGNIRISDTPLMGSHWAMADPCFCVERRCKGRRDRQSKFNLENKMTVQNHNITEEQVLAECAAHLNDEVAICLE
jgi:hypothetical protein